MLASQIGICEKRAAAKAVLSRLAVSYLRFGKGRPEREQLQ
jgi:hypothetical protein